MGKMLLYTPKTLRQAYLISVITVYCHIICIVILSYETIDRDLFHRSNAEMGCKDGEV